MIESIQTSYEYDVLIHVVSKDKEILEYSRNLLLQKFPEPVVNILMQPNVDNKPVLVTGMWNYDSPYIFRNVEYNIGFAHCVNDALEHGYVQNNYDAILFVNSDIQFSHNDIDKMVQFHKAKPNKLITIGGTHSRSPNPENSHGFACAILPKAIFEEIGYFDENLFPAYMEDCDYFTRLWLHRKLGPLKIGFNKLGPDSPLLEHINTGGVHHEGSAVIYSDSKMFELNQQTHGQNMRYYTAKWGGLNDKETFMSPFDENVSLYIPLETRHDPYPDYWDRSKEKLAYYKKYESI
ncbi:MAG: glycosyltransferase family 2 protein [Candidatus Pacearchaeota archaeon]